MIDISFLLFTGCLEILKKYYNRKILEELNNKKIFMIFFYSR